MNTVTHAVILACPEDGSVLVAQQTGLDYADVVARVEHATHPESDGVFAGYVPLVDPFPSVCH